MHDLFFPRCQADQPEGANLPAEKKAKGGISMKTYWNYITAGGNLLVLFVVLIFFIAGEVSF